MFGKILDKAAYFKAKIARDSLEIALAEATTDDNWQASTSVLHQIASSAYDREKWKRINDFLWDKLKNNKNWKKILKALNIVEFLLKNGPGFTCNQLRYELQFFQALESFTEYEGSADRGAPIRQRARSIVSMLENEELLEDERLRAHQIREKMSQLTGGSNYNEKKPGGQVLKYQSYNSENYSGVEQKSHGYYNYGHGNYGDRDDNKKYNHDYFQNANRFQNTEPEKLKPKLKVERAEPELVSPKTEESPVRVKNYIENESPSKPKFSTITQHLLKGSTNQHKNTTIERTGQVIKPDLSYKQDKNEEQLIDLGESQFMETRYHFESPSPQSISQKATLNTQQIEIPQEKHQNPVSTSSNPSEGFDFISFLGIPSTIKPAVQNGAKASTNSVVTGNLPLQTIQSPPQSQSQSQPQPQPQPTLQPTLQPMQQLPPQTSPYNSMYTNIQPSYQIPFQPPLNPYSQPYNPYQNFNSPYGYQPQPYYGQPPVYAAPGYPQYNSYPQQNLTGYNNTPVQSNPYANVTQNLSSVVLDSPSKPPQQSYVSSQKENISQSKSKGGNMDLTDLSDIMSDISAKKKTQTQQTAPVQHNNNIKIDPWAW